MNKTSFRRRRSIYWLGCALVILLTRADAAQTEDPRLTAFRAALAQDYIVSTNGTLQIADLIQMVDNHKLDSAGGNQATQPYVRMQVPRYPLSEDDFVDLDTAAFRIRPDEAVVYVGPTPPKCDYFSFVTFLFVRHTNAFSEKGDWLFASVRDPLNHLLLQTEDGPEKPFAANTMVIFTADHTTYRSITNIAEQAGYPASMLNAYVLPATNLFLGVDPAKKPDTLVLAIRTANFADPIAKENYLTNTHYGAVYRLTPKTARELDAMDPPAWRNRESTNEWELIANKAPGWNVTNAMDQLRDAIISAIPNVGVTSFDSTRWFYDSQEVLKEDPSLKEFHQYVAGESSDTPYLRSATPTGAATNFSVGPNDLLVVYGVNHQASGLATYANFALYGDWIVSDCAAQPGDARWYPIGCNDRLWNGVVGLNSHSYVGSAAEYLPGDPNATNFLYASIIVRGTLTARHNGNGLVLGWSYGTLEAAEAITGPWSAVPGASAPTHTVAFNSAKTFYRVRLPAFSVPLANPPDPLPSPYLFADSIPFDYPTFVGYRAYLNPATKAGPSYNNIIPDRALLFKLR
jgi:hypothetical protein